MFIQELIGREPEILSLNEATTSPRAELIAVYGRRRVGKTFLIRTVYEQNIVFELTGLKDANLTAQLENFSDTLADTFKPPIPLERPTKWMQAFRQLIHFIEADIREEKKSNIFRRVPVVRYA
jgi:AAA+ ATPase superfamily predicted ATPase